MPGYGPASLLRGGDLGVQKSRRSDVRDALLITVAFWVLVLALWLDVRSIAGILERISTTSMNIHGDFDTFWRSSAAFWEGRDVYDTGARLQNLNPPLWILLISPFGLLEPLVAYRVFVLMTLVMTVGYLAWMADELRLRPVWAVVGTAMLLFSSPLLATLALGQIYPILALLLVAAWMADRRDKLSFCGGILGVVVALKPSLAPILLWPLVRRPQQYGGERGLQRGRGDARRGRRGGAGGHARLAQAALRPVAQPDPLLGQRFPPGCGDPAVHREPVRPARRDVDVDDSGRLRAGDRGHRPHRREGQAGRGGGVVGARRGVAPGLAHRLAQLPRAARPRHPAAPGAGTGGAGFSAPRPAVHPGAVAPALE